jgi:hypothetical protein
MRLRDFSITLYYRRLTNYLNPKSDTSSTSCLQPSLAQTVKNTDK